MTASMKKPPPDHPGNLRGRIHRLLENAALELRDEGMEKSKIPEAARAKVNKKLKKLEARLEKVAHLGKPVQVDEGRRLTKSSSRKKRREVSEAAPQAKRSKRVPKKKVTKREEVQDLQDIFDLLDMGEA